MLRTIFFICLINILHLQGQTLQQKLEAIPGIEFKRLPNEAFREAYEVSLLQPLDHANTAGSKFRQRFFLGFNSFDSLNVIDTDGYAINYALNRSYEHELSSLLNSNLFIVEHRYFGTSIPDSLDYRYLTTTQAAEDTHRIKSVMDSLFKNKWISTGISKGGQAALAYKIHYPEDVSFTITYGTAVKQDRIENKIDSKLKSLSQTECGKKLSMFQNRLFNNKKDLVILLEDFRKRNGISFGKRDVETILDLMILELPFSFWQSGLDCTLIPITSEDPKELFEALSSIISPSFYSEKTLKRLQPSFYMSYHELGFYEYQTRKFKKYLTDKDLSNLQFAPDPQKLRFDRTYLNSLNNFLNTDKAESILFIYGENDPWSSMQDTGRAKKIIVKNGSHKSRLKNLDPDQRSNILHTLRKFTGN